MDALITMLNGAITGLITFLTSWLPDDPFTGFVDNFETFAHASETGLGWLNWFFPFSDMSAALAALISAVLICAVARLAFIIVELIPGE